MQRMFVFSAFLFTVFLNGISQETKKVLFIGNSYTYYNNLPQMLADMALTTNDTVIFDSSTPGGYTLQAHTTNQTTLNKIMAGGWDFVVLQEQSQRPSFPLSQVQVEVFPYAQFLDSMINAYNPCAETVFYMTWGRKNGDAANCPVWPPVCTYGGMDSLLHLRYMMMAEMNDAIVSPVGAVWRYIRTQYPSIELYDPDESHPSLKGTYAAALTFYTALFRKNPILVQFNSSLTVSEANNIKQAVRNVVYDSLSHWFVGAYDPVADFSFMTTGNEVSFLNNSAFASAYYWEFGDGNVSYNENPVHEYSSDGNYNATLIAAHCSYADTISKSVQITGVQVKEQERMNHVFIYPNPATENIFVHSGHGSSTEIIGIFDIYGKLLVLPAVQNQNVLNIETMGLLPGIYFIRLTRNGMSVDMKFLKL
jgi:hypothetical protein